jgi:hypothetical protein
VLVRPPPVGPNGPFRGLVFALAGSLLLWALLALVATVTYIVVFRGGG